MSKVYLQISIVVNLVLYVILFFIATRSGIYYAPAPLVISVIFIVDSLLTLIGYLTLKKIPKDRYIRIALLINATPIVIMVVAMFLGLPPFDWQL